MPPFPSANRSNQNAGTYSTRPGGGGGAIDANWQTGGGGGGRIPPAPVLPPRPRIPDNNPMNLPRPVRPGIGPLPSPGDWGPRPPNPNNNPVNLPIPNPNNNPMNLPPGGVIDANWQAGGTPRPGWGGIPPLPGGWGTKPGIGPGGAIDANWDTSGGGAIDANWNTNGIPPGGDNRERSGKAPRPVPQRGWSGPPRGGYDTFTAMSGASPAAQIPQMGTDMSGPGSVQNLIGLAQAVGLALAQNGGFPPGVTPPPGKFPVGPYLPPGVTPGPGKGFPVSPPPIVSQNSRLGYLNEMSANPILRLLMGQGGLY